MEILSKPSQTLWDRDNPIPDPNDLKREWGVPLYDAAKALVDEIYQQYDVKDNGVGTIDADIMKHAEHLQWTLGRIQKEAQEKAAAFQELVTRRDDVRIQKMKEDYQLKGFGHALLNMEVEQ